MALSLSSVSWSKKIDPGLLRRNAGPIGRRTVKFERKKTAIAVKSDLKESSSDETSPNKEQKLEIGSPIVIVEAPKMVKTADSMPCLRVNSGIVKAGDAGRIVSRKPKDVWAVRFSNGTFLIDGKYFQPLELQD